jgi:hypothetical protein
VQFLFRFPVMAGQWNSSLTAALIGVAEVQVDSELPCDLTPVAIILMLAKFNHGGWALMEVIPSEDLEPSKGAVRAGRAVFFFVGTVCLVVTGLFSYFVPETNVLLAVLLFGGGLILIWLAFVLPPRTVALWGFFLPWFLPDE